MYSFFVAPFQGLWVRKVEVLGHILNNLIFSLSSNSLSSRSVTLTTLIVSSIVDITS